MISFPRRHAGAFAVLFCLGAAQAQAQSSKHIEIARNWGLLGVWRLDCDKPETRSNIRIEFVARDGQLYYERRYEGVTDRSKVVDVLANPDGSIQVTVRFDKEDATYQWTSIHEGRVGLRTIESRNISTGAYAIRGGKIVSSGRRALLQTHCE